jgi:hypothetical protein
MLRQFGDFLASAPTFRQCAHLAVSKGDQRNFGSDKESREENEGEHKPSVGEKCAPAQGSV